MDRHWDENPKVMVFYKLFAINLPFTTKQYKVDNIANFVYYGKTRLDAPLDARCGYTLKYSLKTLQELTCPGAVRRSLLEVICCCC